MKKWNLHKIILLFGVSIFGCNSSDKAKDSRKSDLPSVANDIAMIPQYALTSSALTQNDHPLWENINTFLKEQEVKSEFEQSGLQRDDYLKVIESQVRAMIKYQDDHGRIIDPVEKEEKFYTTPCFAHSVSALVASSRINIDDDLAMRGMKALDISLNDMVNATVNGNHGDFYTWPVMLAYNMFKPFTGEERLKSWDDKIESIRISKLYQTYNKPKQNNWVLVHTAGEFLRAQGGFTSFDYVEKMLGYQLANFTELGMYNEHGNPLPYDLFPRHYLSGMLQQNYKGEHALALKENLWKGAWTSLFMQSPFGELPTGYRSSHHIWNEAQQCVVFEIYASAYAKLGREKEAGAFKRAALLSLGSINRWVREDGSGYIVKNRFPIENKHGYEIYSMHTCYNMLAASMLAQAWQFSNNDIKELPSPADVGGFVLPILEPFHKIFTNADGTYLEYETKGDKMYNPTGIIRAHIDGANPQLGPSNGLAPLFSGEGVYLATGPSWQNETGKWISLAEHNPESQKVEVLQEHTDSVQFQIIHELCKEGKQCSIQETISIKEGKIIVQTEFKGIKGRKRISWPMLISDGKDDVAVELTENSASLILNEKGVRFSILVPEVAELKKSGTSINHINGIAEAIHAEFSGTTVTYVLEKV